LIFVGSTDASDIEFIRECFGWILAVLCRCGSRNGSGLAEAIT
jgi:hypothetical protein